MSQIINIKRIKFFKFKDGYGQPLFLLDEGFRVIDVFYDAIGRNLGTLVDLKNYVEFCGCKFDGKVLHEWCDISSEDMENIIQINKEILKSSLSK